MQQLKTIFIVEDNLYYGELLKKQLEKFSDDIHLFHDGEACLKNLHLRPDVVILDYYLENSMDGLSVLKQIKGYNPDIHVVFLTAQETISIAVEALKFGAFDYVEKNEVTFNKLDKIIVRIFELNDVLRVRSSPFSRILKRFSLFSALFFFLLFLASCSADRILVSDMEASGSSGSLSPLRKSASQALTEHIIKPDDKLSLSIWDHDDLSIGSIFGIYNSNEVYGKWVLVDKDNMGVFPQIGAVRIGGLTATKASELLASKYAALIKNPIVVVKVLNRQITILGEVKNPGVYTLDKEQNSLFEIIGRAGGTNYYADNSKITIMRGDINRPETHLVDLRKISNLQNSTLLLQSDDIVYVPPRSKQKFDKEVGVYVGIGSILTSMAVILTGLLK